LRRPPKKQAGQGGDVGEPISYTREGGELWANRRGNLRKRRGGQCLRAQEKGEDGGTG
jgi:hypothetical protein